VSLRGQIRNSVTGEGGARIVHTVSGLIPDLLPSTDELILEVTGGASSVAQLAPRTLAGVLALKEW
jgi:hypothetical protein